MYFSPFRKSLIWRTLTGRSKTCWPLLPHKVLKAMQCTHSCSRPISLKDRFSLRRGIFNPWCSLPNRNNLCSLRVEISSPAAIESSSEAIAETAWEHFQHSPKISSKKAVRLFPLYASWNSSFTTLKCLREDSSSPQNNRELSTTDIVRSLPPSPSPRKVSPLSVSPAVEEQSPKGGGIELPSDTKEAKIDILVDENISRPSSLLPPLLGGDQEHRLKFAK